MWLIELSAGYEAIIDDEAIEEIQKYNWHAVVTPNHVYARRCTDYKYVYMHHQILKVSLEELKPKDLCVDHIDRNSLNNTRENLRIVTRAENVRNSPAFKNRGGVYFHKQSGKYCVASLGFHYGQYKTREEAELVARRLGLANH